MQPSAVAQFHGGPIDGQITQLQQLSHWWHCDVLTPPSPLDTDDTPIGRRADYELVLGFDHKPALGGDGRYHYQFKGFRAT